MEHCWGRLEEEVDQGQHKRMGTWEPGMSDEEWRKCVVSDTGYHLSCMSRMGSLLGFLCGKWIRGEN